MTWGERREVRTMSIQQFHSLRTSCTFDAALQWLKTATHNPGNRAKVRRKVVLCRALYGIRGLRKLPIDAEVHTMAERPTCVNTVPYRLQRPLLLGDLTPDVHPVLPLSIRYRWRSDDKSNVQRPCLLWTFGCTR
jgi:hypothetical protein